MRYALYYTPPSDSSLWKLGSRWLGRDALSGEQLARPSFHGLSDSRLAELTKVPAHYGFHATIVPPFRLAKGISEEQLLAALEHFSLRQQSLPLAGRLEVSLLDTFFCLRPTRHSTALQNLAALCIREFDYCRAPLSPSEMARRKAARLSGPEKRNLEIWGYPYVFEQFRFHFTLTARLAEGREKEKIHAVLTEMFPPASQSPLTIDRLSLFVEPDTGQPMRCLHQFPFPSSPAPERRIAHDQQRYQENVHPRYECHSA